MKEYKVEVGRTQTFVVTVTANNEREAAREVMESDILDEVFPKFEHIEVHQVDIARD
jgi:hypothetical protein